MALSKARNKLYRSLHQKKGRRESRLFIVEGPDLVNEAIKEGWPLQEIFLTHHFGLEVEAGQQLVKLADLTEIPCDFCSQKEMNQITDTQTPQGAVALASLPEETIRLEDESPEILLFCEQISDPGNLGTILRTADWFGVKEIVLGEGSVDPFSPKVVRSSAGSIFRVVVQLEPDVRKRIAAEAESGRRIFAAAITGSLSPHDLPRQGLRGLVVGHERRGVTDEIAVICEKTVHIPAGGQAESLNLAVATGILLYALTGID